MAAKELFEIRYKSSNDPGCPVFSIRKSAYNLEHLYDRWYEEHTWDNDWTIISVKRVATTGVQARQPELHKA